MGAPKWEHSPSFEWSVLGPDFMHVIKRFLLWERGTVEAENDLVPEKQDLRECSRNECDRNAQMSDLLQQVHIAPQMVGN